MTLPDMILFVLVQINSFTYSTPCHVIVATDLVKEEVQVTFPSGQTTVETSFGIKDDDIAECPEMFDLELEILEKALGNGVIAISPNTTEITIIDNDGMK